MARQLVAKVRRAEQYHKVTITISDINSLTYSDFQELYKEIESYDCPPPEYMVMSPTAYKIMEKHDRGVLEDG